MMLVPLFTALVPTSASAASSEPLKKRATYFTEEKIANARENIEKYPWAAAQKNSSVNAAETYLKKYSLEELWALMPSQEIYRSYGVNQTYGCLNCGNEIDKYGNYPYKYDVMNDPWKITCPNCGMKFPTNDFESFYKSGLDENGIFHRQKADKKYLKNVLYPEKGENWGVDNGTYYTHTNGQRYFFVAYYAHWALWYSGIITNAIDNFYLAYLYTGEQKYADACIVMLCRMGDLYPSFNIADCPWGEGYRHSGGTRGKLIGSIWETGLVNHFTYAYDAMFTAFPNLSSEALKLLSSKNSKIQSYKDVMVNIEDGFIKVIYPTVRAHNIEGNNGMHQQSLSLAAIVLDDPTLSKTWLDYVFASNGGNVAATFVDTVDHDGWGNEASPGYNSGWLSNYIGLANALVGYKIAGTGPSYDLYNNIKFKKMFAAGMEIMATRYFSPNVGDAGSTGSSGAYSSTSYLMYAYEVYKDVKYAQMIYFLMGGNVSGLKLTIWDKDPESISSRVEKDVKENGEFVLESHMLTGYGLALLMNVTEGHQITSDEKNQNIELSDVSIINVKENPNVERTDEAIVFTPEKAGDSFSLGFKTSAAAGIYEFIVYSAGAAGAGKYSVFVDGKLIQTDVSFNTSPGEKTPVYFRKTIKIIPGFHVVSFRSTSESGPMSVSGFKIIRQSNVSTAASYVNPETTMGIYFGRNTGHGHYDTLNLYLYGFGTDLSPDLGYPEFCDGTPNQVYWVENTVSHNTVLINDNHMNSQIVSQPRAFDAGEFVKLVSVNADRVYSGSTRYGRTAALIKIDDDDSYVVDFFAVTGGSKHTYSFHPAESSALTTTGLEFVSQVDDSGNYVGTVQGRNVAWGVGNYASGYQYLDKVRKDEDPDSVISFDWSIVDTRNLTVAENMHLKFTMHNELESVILANGTPPRNKAGNPAGLDYVLANRKGSSKGLSSLFVSVIEPYIGVTNILSQELCKVTTGSGEVTDDSVKVLKITLENGRTDYVCYAEDEETVFTVDGKFYFKGFFGVYSVKGDKTYTYNVDSVFDKVETVTAYEGVVVDFTTELTDKNSITVSFTTPDVDISKVIGNYIYIANDGVRNACYYVRGAEKSGDNYVLDIGDITLIRSYSNASKPENGFVYNVSKRRAFTVPLTAVNGNVSDMVEKSFRSVAGLTLSNYIRKDAVASDRVGYLYVINNNITYLYEKPDYQISVTGGKYDGDMFEVKDGWLYLSDKFVSGKSSYTVEFIVSDPATGEKYVETMSIDTLSTSQSQAQLYPEFKLTETKELAEFEIKPVEPDVPVDPSSPSSSSDINWILIAIVFALCAAVIIVTVILKKKTGAAG